MDLNLPSFTIATPVFNGARYFARTITSIRAQRYPALEYVVQDGGSTDGSWELAQGSRDVVSRLEQGSDRGMYDALGKAFAGARGDILGWVNSDDLLMPWCLHCVGAYFSANPSVLWVTGVPGLVNEHDQLVWVAQVAPRYRRQWIRRGLYSGMGLGPIQQESTFFRRSLYEKVGGLDRGLRLAGDFHLWRRFAEETELVQLGTVVAAFRVHGTNLTVDMAEYYSEARAIRVPYGKILGSTYSYWRFLLDRATRVPRLDRTLLSRPVI